MKNLNSILLTIITFFIFGCVPPTKQKPVVKKQEAVPKIGFLVNKSLGVSSANELDGAAVCLITGVKEEIMVSDYFKKNNMTYEAVTVGTKNELFEMYEAGRCDTILVNQDEVTPNSNSIILNIK